MFKDNHSDVDLDALAARVRRHAATCRRPDVAPVASASPVYAPLTPTWRDRLRSWPVIGPLAVYTYRHLRAASQPGLSVRARIRALPFIGAAGAWFSALASLPSWRRHLHQQDARLTQEVASLRAAQTSLMRDLASAHIAIRALQTQLDAQRGEDDDADAAPR